MTRKFKAAQNTHLKSIEMNHLLMMGITNPWECACNRNRDKKVCCDPSNQNSVMDILMIYEIKNNTE